jgi:hypothetical protein
MWSVLNVPIMWYFNCPGQRGMLLLFLQCGILTVPDNVECFYCSYSVIFVSFFELLRQCDILSYFELLR